MRVLLTTLLLASLVSCSRQGNQTTAIQTEHPGAGTVPAGAANNPTPTPLPDNYGVFAISDGQLLELTKLARSEMKSVLMGGSGFTALPNPEIRFPLQIVVYGGATAPKLLPARQVAPGKFQMDWDQEVALTVAPIAGQQPMYRLMPAAHVDSGIYVFTIAECPDNRYEFRCYYPLTLTG